MMNVKKHLKSRWLNFGVFITGFSTVVTTLLVLPFLSYISIAWYGFPASLYILFGYILWSVLTRTHLSKDITNIFGIAFLISGSIVLVPLFIFGVPIMVILMVLPTVCVWFIEQILLGRKMKEQ